MKTHVTTDVGINKHFQTTTEDYYRGEQAEVKEGFPPEA